MKILAGGCDFRNKKYNAMDDKEEKVVLISSDKEFDRICNKCTFQLCNFLHKYEWKRYEYDCLF